MKIVLATPDTESCRMVTAFFKSLGHEVLALQDAGPDPPDLASGGDSFVQNARARAVAAASWSGHIALGEDSGLVVEALGGEPGVRSADYAGEGTDSQANISLLLDRMEKLPGNERLAHLSSAICLASPDGNTWEFEGKTRGIVTVKRKGLDGTGYEEVFFFPEAGMTFAEMPVLVKRTVTPLYRALTSMSHRLKIIEREMG